MKRKMPVLILLFFCFCQKYIYAQTPFFKQTFIARENGSLGVNTMIIDKDRFLWIGTQEGLYKYNGRSSSIYFLNKKNISQDVSAVFEDSHGEIWAGFRFGDIAILKDSILKPAPLKGLLPTKAITAITEDHLGRIWLTTAGDGVFYIYHNTLFRISSENGLTDDYTYAIAEDRFGRMWIGTDQGISICAVDSNGVKIIKINAEKGIPDEIARDIKADMNGNMWIGLQEKGVCIINSSTLQITIPEWSTNWEKGQVNELILNEKEIWIATDDEGLFTGLYHTENELHNYKSFDDLKFPEIKKMLVDAENNLWLGNKSGLIQSHGNWMMFLNEINNQKLNFVHAVFIDAENNLYFTPDQGLIKIPIYKKDFKLKKYTITPAKDLCDIVSMYEDECGYIWIGTMGMGLYRLNTTTGVQQKIASADLDKASILSIAGNNNELWLATLGGVVRCILPDDCNTDKIEIQIRKLDSVPELGNYYIYTVFVDSKDRVWFGTDKKGITCYDKNKYHNFNTDNGLLSNSVYSITEDLNGNIWFSEAGEGICKFNGKTFHNYGSKDGLREMTVTSIRAIGADRIMLVHKRGIDILHTQSGKIDYYGVKNNLADVNPDLNVIAFDHGGKIWVGTEKGLVIFNPALNSNPAGPKTVLQRVSLFDQKKNFISQKEFNYNQNYIAFDFAGIWFTDPGRIQYQYMLDGYNKEWINTADNHIIYPNLPPGNYVFKVRTSLSRSFTIADETTYSFVIKKPFWTETWFRAMVLLLLFAGGGLYISAHDQRLKRMEALKKESIEYRFETLKSQVNPHFLFNSFNTLISIIEKDQHIAVEYVEKLSDYFRNMIQHRDKETIILEDEIEMVSTYYYLQKKRFGNYLELDVRLSKEVLKLYKVPPLSLQLLIENAVKHNMISRETPLKVEIFQSADETITVRNNINVKLNKEVSTGIGLMNITNRYKILSKGQVLIFSDLNSFSVTVPLIK